MSEKLKQEQGNSPFCCPVCGGGLKRDGNSCRCGAGHCFDYAKSGYLNLLPPNGKHSKDPGDNNLMVEARRAFLAKGYYEPLLRAFSELALVFLPEEGGRVLDAGCGEGYYTGGMARFLKEKGRSAEVFGVDISKTAVDKAAKGSKELSFAVASVFHLPVSDASCALFCNLFAPFCRPEIERVLCEDGLLLMAIPGEEHLWELKERVYEKPYKNEVKDFALEGFRLRKHRTLRFPLHLRSGEDIENLFRMTPYYYKTSREGQARLNGLEEFTVTACFELLAYQKEEGKSPEKPRKG